MQKQYFYSLSGLRGVAALFVVMVHAQAFFYPFTAPMGYMAVYLFFLLSGVVIESSYANRLRHNLGIFRFLWIRVERLYPLYLLGMVLMGFCILSTQGGAEGLNARFGLGIPNNGVLWLPAFVFLPLLSGPNMFPLDPCAWSLFFELLANLVYACLAPNLSTRSALVISLCSLALLIPDALLHDQNLFTTGTLRAGFSFFLGVVMAKNFQKCPQKLHAGWAWFAIFVTGAALAIRVPQSDVPLIFLAAVTLFFPSLVWLAMRAEPDRLALILFTLTGNASYAIYVLHEPLIVFIKIAESHFYQTRFIHSPLEGFAFLSLLLLVGTLLNNFYDTPARHWLSRVTLNQGPFTRASLAGC